MIRFGRRLHQKELEAYNHIAPALLKDVRIFRVKKVLPAYTGITLGNWIFLMVDQPQDGTSVLLAHELVHVRQWQEQGKVRFLVDYLRCFIKGYKKQRSWSCAYREIDAECEARAEAQRWADEHFC